MARSKKTRKVGENSPKMQPRQKKSERVLAAKKRDNGHKSGSRHNEHQLIKSAPGSSASGIEDSRHGSKKPIALNITINANNEKSKSIKVTKPKLTDEQKLMKLENDPRLNQLLDMLEEGRELPIDDQQWLDKQLDKIEQLLTKLGISEEDDIEQITRSLTDEELLHKFESGEELLKKYTQE